MDQTVSSQRYSNCKPSATSIQIEHPKQQYYNQLKPVTFLEKLKKMKHSVLLCLCLSTTFAYVVYPKNIPPTNVPYQYGYYEVNPYGYAMKPYPAPYQEPPMPQYRGGFYPPQPPMMPPMMRSGYMPKLKATAPVSTEDASVETTTVGKKDAKKKTKTSKKSMTTTPEPIVDPQAQIDALKLEYQTKRDDLKTAYKTKVDDLNAKYEDKATTMVAIYPDEADPAWKFLEDEFNKKLDDLKTKYEMKDYDLTSKYQMKINALLPLLPSTTPAPTTSSEEVTNDDEMAGSLKTLVQMKVDALKTEYQMKRNAMMLAFQTKMNDLKTKYTTKYATWATVYPDPDSPVMTQLELDFETKVNDLVTKYQLKEADMTIKYKTKIATVSQMVDSGITSDEIQLGGENYTLPENSSNALKTYIDEKLQAMKLEYQMKHDLLLQSYQTKMDTITSKYSEKFVNYTKLFTEDNPIFKQLQAEFTATINDLVLKYKTKENDLLTKYKAKIDALTPKSDDDDSSSSSSSEENNDTTLQIVPKKLKLNNFFSDEASESMEFIPLYFHELNFDTPLLKATKPEAETTTKLPTMADIYWASFGAKIKETFNKTANATAPGDGAVGADDETATPVPATFWASYGKTIGKSFTDAKTKIIKAMKATTTTAAPMAAADSDEDISNEVPSVVAPIEPTFWDDFTKTLGDVLAQKSLMKTTTPTPDMEVMPKLKLRMPAPDAADSTVVAPGSPMPVIPGIYWKTFGDKIKESFNKSKTAPAADDGTGAGVAPTPIAPLFWMNFGKSLAKAFTDAKFRLISATKPTLPPTTPGATPGDDTVVNPDAVLDEAFWTDFGKQLDDVLQAKAAATAPILVNPTPVDSEPMDDDTNGFLYPPLRLQMPEPTPVGEMVQPLTPITVVPYNPGLYWKGYGDQMSDYFITSKGDIISAVNGMKMVPFPFMVPSVAPSPVPAPAPAPAAAPTSTRTASKTTTTPTYTPPGLYWKGYGDTFASHFLGKKGQIIDTVSKIKPTPALNPLFVQQTNGMASMNDPLLDDDYRKKRSTTQQFEDVQQSTNDWGEADDLQQSSHSGFETSGDLVQQSSRNFLQKPRKPTHSQAFTDDLQQSSHSGFETSGDLVQQSSRDLLQKPRNRKPTDSQADDLQQSSHTGFDTDDLVQQSSRDLLQPRRKPIHHSQDYTQDFQQSHQGFDNNDDLTQQSSRDLLRKPSNRRPTHNADQTQQFEDFDAVWQGSSHHEYLPADSDTQQFEPIKVADANAEFINEDAADLHGPQKETNLVTMSGEGATQKPSRWQSFKDNLSKAKDTIKDSIFG